MAQTRSLSGSPPVVAGAGNHRYRKSSTGEAAGAAGWKSTGCDYSWRFLFFQAEGGIRDYKVTGVQTCALPIYALYPDVWVSRGDDEREAATRRAALAPYRLDDALLDRAAPGAIALHCLPAHPGEEITDSVLYGERQRIWEQAENRRHAQKALLEWLLSG